MLQSYLDTSSPAQYITDAIYYRRQIQMKQTLPTANRLDVMFRAFSDRTRLRILYLLQGGECCVGNIVDILDIEQPSASRHLAYLRRARIVTARREGKWMHYRVVEPPDKEAARIFQEARASLATDPEMQRDRVRLLKTCCAPQLPVQLRRAPRPLGLVA